MRILARRGGVHQKIVLGSHSYGSVYHDRATHGMAMNSLAVSFVLIWINSILLPKDDIDYSAIPVHVRGDYPVSHKHLLSTIRNCHVAPFTLSRGEEQHRAAVRSLPSLYFLEPHHPTSLHHHQYKLQLQQDSIQQDLLHRQ